MLIYILLTLVTTFLAVCALEFWFWRHRMHGVNDVGQEQRRRSQRRALLLTESLAGIGVILVLSGSGVAIGQRWLHVTDWERTGILGAAAGCFLSAGAVVRWLSGSQRQSLTAALWVISTACVGAVTAIPAVRIYGASGPATTLAAGAAIAVYSSVLLLMCRRELLMITALAGLVGALCGAVMLVAGDAAPWLTVALGLWLVGLAWAALGWLYPEPLRTSISLGAAVALLAPAIAAHEVGWVYAIGIATSAGIMAASFPLRNVVMVAFGACALSGYITAAVLTYSRGSLGIAGTLVIVGAVLIGTALMTVRLGRTVRRPPGSIPATSGERTSGSALQQNDGSDVGPEGRADTGDSAGARHEHARAA